MKISEEIRRENDKLWILSQDHSFVQAIANDVLPEDKFKFYMFNDLYFLEHYVNAHFHAAALATDYDVKNWLANKCNNMVKGQIEERDQFRKRFNITDSDIKEFVPAPSAYGYTSHLYRECMSGDLARIIAAVLPCYWVYADIGLKYKDCRPEKDYCANFIDTYSSDRFQEGSNYMVNLLDTLCMNYCNEHRQLIKDSFVLATEYELAFWEMSWSKEQWLSKSSKNI